MDGVSVTIAYANTKSVEKSLDKLAAQAMREIIAPAVKEAAKAAAGQIKSLIPNATGTMKQAVGVTTFHVYGDNEIAWQGAGVRRGYGRMIAVVETKQGTKLKRLSKKASAKSSNRGYFYSDPAKIAHILEGGRSAIEAGKNGKKALFDPRTGKFFTRSQGTMGRKFIEQVEKSGTSYAILQKAADDVGKLLNDSLKGT